jgi:hypothetical protein
MRPTARSFLLTARRNFTDVVEPEAVRKVRRVIKTKDKRPIIQSQRKVNNEHIEKAKTMGLPWRIVGAT